MAFVVVATKMSNLVTNPFIFASKSKIRIIYRVVLFCFLPITYQARVGQVQMLRVLFTCLGLPADLKAKEYTDTRIPARGLMFGLTTK